jgi:hypothetical protein
MAEHAKVRFKVFCVVGNNNNGQVYPVGEPCVQVYITLIAWGYKIRNAQIGLKPFKTLKN